METISLVKNSKELFTEESIFIPLHDHDQLHLKRFCGDANGQVIFMVHGSVENGRIFYSKNGKGLAPFLARNGYDVFVGDLRGRGQSTPPINKYSDYGLSECIDEEIPAFIEKITSLRGDARIHWIAHSWGGILLLSYYARNAGEINPSSMIFFGTKRQITVSGFRKFWTINIFYNFIFKLIIRMKGFVDVKSLKMGMENETTKSRRQTYEWVTSDEWKGEDGFNYAEALKHIPLPPLLFIAGASDEVLGHQEDVKKLMEEIGTPDAQFYLAAKSKGNKHNYDHVSMLTHPDAPSDHFQYILQWLQRR
jgi:alpha-beta hydrolase superfamily lysophospholipase